MAVVAGVERVEQVDDVDEAYVEPRLPVLRARRSVSDGLPSRAERSTRTAELLREREVCTDEEERARLTAELVHVNRGVAVAMAMRYRDRGVPLDDLVQTAFVGLTKAVVRFDSGLADDLLTFAVPTIRGQLQRHFRDHTWSVRPPRRVQELHHLVRDRSELLCQELGREPSAAELAEDLGLGVADVEEALLAQDCFRTLSLDQPAVAGSGVPLGDLLPGEVGETELVDARVALGTAVRRLPERERRLLYLRYFEERTQAEIGSVLGVSQMQVSRLLSGLLGRLREEIA
jgi:RNA polymerase sigma-B factor